MLKRYAVVLVAVTLFLGYDADEESVALSKIRDVQRSYNDRVLGTFDSAGHLTMTQAEALVCIAQMHTQKEALDRVFRQYRSTSAVHSLESHFLSVRITNRLEQCQKMLASHQ